MARPLADVVVPEIAQEGVEVVRVERGAQLFEQGDHSFTRAP
jgi:hypothetical protein